jgi:hypothetical protein
MGAVLYFCSFVLLCGLVLVNFVIGVIIDNFASSSEGDKLPISKASVDHFAQVCTWAVRNAFQGVMGCLCRWLFRYRWVFPGYAERGIQPSFPFVQATVASAWQQYAAGVKPAMGSALHELHSMQVQCLQQLPRT